jgi:hypothetical protein
MSAVFTKKNDEYVTEVLPISCFSDWLDTAVEALTKVEEELH